MGTDTSDAQLAREGLVLPKKGKLKAKELIGFF